jgi:AcrR family transcriptional regulator
VSEATGIEGARRMSSEARREQLAAAAVAEVASGGYTGLTLDAVADRAGVTRNLLYHYFPRGRLDLFLAAVDRAGRILTEDWVTDEGVPIEERLAANFARFFEHALEPSDVWLVHRQGRLLGEPEVAELGRRYRTVVVEAVALNHFGTERPGPFAESALRSFLDFAEKALDECRERDLDRERFYLLMTDTLLGVVASVKASGGG